MITDELRKLLATAIGLNWETVQTSLREAAYPQPPYKEPLMYLIYLIPEIPWRQCEKLSSRLKQAGSKEGLPNFDFIGVSEEALQLTESLDKAAIDHRPYHL